MKLQWNVLPDVVPFVIRIRRERSAMQEIKESAPRSRRAILAAAAGAAAATAAAAVGRPLDASADTGDPLILGQANIAGDPTSLEGHVTFQGPPPAPGPGRETVTITSQGSNTPGSMALLARGGSGSGVVGVTDGGHGSQSAGVIGASGSSNGVGVSAVNRFGWGLDVAAGKVRVRDRSGRATVSAGRSSVDIDLRQKGGLGGTPCCFANLMSYRPGVFVTTVRPNYPVAGKARIYLNRAVTSNAYVAWFVLN
jgi:hypothetical protein